MTDNWEAEAEDRTESINLSLKDQLNKLEVAFI